MPEIIVERPLHWANKAQSFNIYIDTNKVGSVGNGETVAFEVSARKHEIVIRNNLISGYKSLDLDLSNNENKTIRMMFSGYMIFFAIIIGSFIGLIFALTKIYLNIETTWITELLFIIFLPALIIIPFFRRYLWKLKEVNPDVEAAKTEEKA